MGRRKERGLFTFPWSFARALVPRKKERRLGTRQTVWHIMRANLRAPQFLKIERYAQRLSHRVCMEMEAPGFHILYCNSGGLSYVVLITGSSL